MTFARARIEPQFGPQIQDCDCAMFANSYSLLAGNGEDPQPVPNAKGAAVKPKKPKKKKGTSAAPEEQPAPVITPPPAAPAPSAAKGPQTANDAGQALESSAVAAGAGEWGSLALQWTDQVGGASGRRAALQGCALGALH